MSDLTVDSTARDQAAAVRVGRDLRCRAARAAPRPDRGAQPRAQRDRVARRRARPSGGRRRRPGAGVRRGARPAARPALRGEGHPRARRVADDVRLTDLRRRRRRPRRPAGRADPPRRCGLHRQDQRAGVRRRVAHLQHGLRRHPQPGRPDPVGRRVQRGSGVRARLRDGAARRGLRHGRLAAQPGVVLRRRRACGRPSAGCPSGRSTTSGSRPRSAGRWPATSATSRCSSP